MRSRVEAGGRFLVRVPVSECCPFYFRPPIFLGYRFGLPRAVMAARLAWEFSMIRKGGRRGIEFDRASSPAGMKLLDASLLAGQSAMPSVYERPRQDFRCIRARREILRPCWCRLASLHAAPAAHRIAQAAHPPLAPVAEPLQTRRLLVTPMVEHVPEADARRAVEIDDASVQGPAQIAWDVRYCTMLLAVTTAT